MKKNYKSNNDNVLISDILVRFKLQSVTILRDTWAFSMY